MTLALIADDEPALARHLQRELSSLWPDLQFTPLARHGVEAAEQIAALRPDVAFLDIQMPGLTGLEAAQGIEGDTRVVFVTAYDEYAVQAFEQQALDYLLKPVKADRLHRCGQRLQQALQNVQHIIFPARHAGAGGLRLYDARRCRLHHNHIAPGRLAPLLEPGRTV